MTKKGILTVISGFSGAGKGTVVKKLTDDYGYKVSVSATTRQPREGEKDGREYFFITKEEFESRIQAQGFLEYAGYVDNYYGTPAEYVDKELSKGHDVILEIEVCGGLQVKEKRPDAVMIFLVPPSADELKKRLISRGTEDTETIEKRLARAYEETEFIGKYNYVVVNDTVDKCAANLNDIIQNEKKKLIHNNDDLDVIINDYKRFERRQ
ncbi:MAG: guanylate kinase [Lachnospiraceae bacterium]|jgi:guanylate kinase